ncbi:OTU deubiquitinase with linear linkage specificity a [Osmerus mordax]|uniref:OTU deubiquitinase with linear linkage specificity a n=1 Tax=Osmerus mordax TaxID=8014 RepID=UPI00350FF208
MSWVKAVGRSVEDVFDEDADDITLQNKEWKYNMEKRVKDGYRDGMDAGKEASLQLGFNLGYKEGAAKTVAIGRLKGIVSAIQCWCQLQRPDSPTPACVTDLLQRVVQHEDSVIQAMVKALEKPPPSVSDVSDCMEDLGVDQGDAGCRGEGCQAADCCKRGGDVDIDLKPSQKPSCSSTTDFLSSEESLERLVQSCMEVVSELGLPEELAQHLKQLKSAA